MSEIMTLNPEADTQVDHHYLTIDELKQLLPDVYINSSPLYNNNHTATDFNLINIDSFAPGNYFLRLDDGSQVRLGEILKTDYGIAIDGRDGSFSIGGDSQCILYPELAKKLGFLIHENQNNQTRVALPSPESLLKALQNFAVNLELHSEYEVIPSTVFVEAYRSGNYPISTDFYYYIHDTQFDHLPAIAMGGEVLVQKLAMICEHLNIDHRDLTSEIDYFTSELTTTIFDYTISSRATINGVFLRMSEAKVKRTLEKRARRIGLNATDLDEIFEHVVATADKFQIEIAPEIRNWQNA